MNAHVAKALDQRFESLSKAPTSVIGARTIVDLALNAYQTEHDEAVDEPRMDPFFRQICMSQIKIFLFSGHDTTSSSICYLFYLLSIHRGVLKRLREEHRKTIIAKNDQVAPSIIKDPSLLNKIPYTTAVIKESLRMFPVVTGVRAGAAGHSVRDATGHVFPTNGFLIWLNPHPLQRDPNLWPEAERFLPERWLVGQDDPLYPAKGAWQAFGHGPRNCIGQELAMLEMKVVLCLVVSRLEVRDCYAELDTGKAKRNTMVEGERGYQVQLSQPQGDLPCRIVRAK